MKNIGVRSSLILIWLSLAAALVIMSRGGYFIAVGHLPIVVVVLLRRHLRRVADLPPTKRGVKSAVAVAVVCMIVLFIAGRGIVGESIAAAWLAFKVGLALLLSLRFFGDLQLFLRARAAAECRRL